MVLGGIAQFFVTNSLLYVAVLSRSCPLASHCAGDASASFGVSERGQTTPYLCMVSFMIRC